MIYELFLEGELADIRQDLGMQLNYNIDDVNKYGSRDTSFSKTIVLPGTAKNNRLLGFVGELGSFNPYGGGANIGANFNPAQTTKAELRANGLLLMKGVFRLTGIVKDRDMVEYEGNLFGELGGFIANIGRGKLEDLDFSKYNHNYDYATIVNSWDNKIIIDVIGSFSSVFGFNYIIINGSFPFELNTLDQITVTNANTSANNKTYTIVSYTYFSNIDSTSILVSESVTTDLVSGSFKIQYQFEAGEGYYYPLIDYGTYSSQKIDYDYRTFRPALYVKEYIDKIFEGSGYTYESNFFDSAFFKKLIIPNNAKDLYIYQKDQLKATKFISNGSDPININFDSFIGNNFTQLSNGTFIYIGATEALFKGNLKISGKYNAQSQFIIRIIYGDLSNQSYDFYQDFWFSPGTNRDVNIDFNFEGTLRSNFQIRVEQVFQSPTYINTTFDLSIDLTTPIPTFVILNNLIELNNFIPKNILQKDFFTWLVQMFNLYITEDNVKEKHLLIEPYVDYYDLTESVDWTYKVARDKPWQIKPMGMLASRFYEYKYKDDTDFYNEGYKKKFNQPYGTNLQDTQFQFAKAKQTLEIGFSPSILVGYLSRDKIVSALYKKSKGNGVDQEERMDTNIRIMMAKKITGVNSWRIVDTGALQNSTPVSLGANLTAYGYAGHFDDPNNPTVDINFGAASEIYFDPNTYPSANLFNDYWSGYIAEIADKDSKILTCHVYLTDLDIAQLDFSKPVFIDGVLWRINKIIDFDASSGELTKVELLKVINNG